MNVQTVRKALLWCTAMNYGLVIVWFLCVWLAHDWMYNLNRNWFPISSEVFDVINYGGIGLYKLGILMFNLMPCIALYIVRPSAE